jgi:hypothetical protein
LLQRKIKIILYQLFFISEERNSHENCTILKKEKIHSSLSPLYIQKVVMKFKYVVEGTQIMTHAKYNQKKKKKKMTGLFGALRPVIP